MRQWLFALGGLLVWTAHFFAICIAASLFPARRWRRGSRSQMTVVALIAVG
jgi:hypothetical protein